MLDWTQLSRQSDAYLGWQDVLDVNFACAVGLPGAEAINQASCKETVRAWVKLIRRETNRLAYVFDRRPELYENSFARLEIEVMVTVLQRDLGVHYRQDLIDMDDAAFFSRAEHLFAHGVIQGKSGTCTSLPVVYVAVGRQLGYPLKLVHTKRHVFARWDEPGKEHFNIECTSRGVNWYPDEHYLEWPFASTSEEA